MKLNKNNFEGMDFWGKVGFLALENGLNVLKVAFRCKKYGMHSFYKAAIKYGIDHDQEKLDIAEEIACIFTLSEIKEAIKLAETL